MPLSLWQNRTIVISNLTALTSHMVLIGISTFLPTYVQGIMGYSPSIAGFTLGMMSIGWPLASTIGGRYMHRIGLRRMSVSGCVAIILGTIIFVLLKPEYGPVYAGSGAFLTGVGLGLLSTASLLIVQENRLEYARLGHGVDDVYANIRIDHRRLRFGRHPQYSLRCLHAAKR